MGVWPVSLFWLSFIAATTTTTSRAAARSSASRSASEGGKSASGGVPRLRLITSAPFRAAYAMPFAMSEVRPRFESFSTRTGITVAWGATPTMPVRLPPRAAIVPATCVPCE